MNELLCKVIKAISSGDFWATNLVAWIVMPLLIATAIRLCLWTRSWCLKVCARLIAGFIARRMANGTQCFVLALPFWPTKQRYRRLWERMDTFAIFSTGRHTGPFIILERLKEAPDAASAAERFLYQVTNALNLTYRTPLVRFLNWIGFSGAANACAPRCVGCRVERQASSRKFFYHSAIAQTRWHATMRERLPTESKTERLSWRRKVELAKAKRESALKGILQTGESHRVLIRQQIHIAEAIIAGEVSDSAGEALRLLNVIGDRDRTREEVLSQTPLAISRVYPFRNP
jgi:hypothetical protein